ncbi:MAG TPA: phosphate signaling complex protein PhoU [Polyangiaceae bacterium LLY-WYZ-14_1]|jgi:phosphate transport system protein|nr:phosphate signaling complex protein PhoU [Polyangiaceae bacterium LLY-WYZ-14_1]
MRGHTSQAFASELQELKDRLLGMGARCERLILMSIHALQQQDPELAREAEIMDQHINADEIYVDDLAVRILALRHPVGRDLRFTLSALKVVVDLERIGDEAVNIAERATDLSGEPELPAPHILLPEMGRVAATMLHRALDSFVEEDGDKARQVLAMDDEADAFYGRLLRESIAHMTGHPERVEPAMAIASCAKYLERIADHATNIAEMVVFLVDGVDVRHPYKR